MAAREVTTHRIHLIDEHPEVDGPAGVEYIVTSGPGHESEVEYEVVALDEGALEEAREIDEEQAERRAADTGLEYPPVMTDAESTIGSTVLLHYLREVDADVADDLVVDRGGNLGDSDEFTLEPLMRVADATDYAYDADADDVIRGIKPSYREAECYALWHGSSATKQEVGWFLGLGVNSVKTHIHNTRQKRQLLKDVKRALTDADLFFERF